MKQTRVRAVETKTTLDITESTIPEIPPKSETGLSKQASSDLCIVTFAFGTAHGNIYRGKGVAHFALVLITCKAMMAGIIQGVSIAFSFPGY